MKIHLVQTTGWILETISSELIKLKAADIKLTRSRTTNFMADINYYINWKHWKSIDSNLRKSNFDIVYFTHLEKDDSLEILNAADLIIAQSNHGLKDLLDKKIPDHKIKVISGMGPRKNLKFKKIKLGISGRPYDYTNRKRQDLLVKLSKDLSNSIFQFVFSNNYWDAIVKDMQRNNADCIVVSNKFWETIDYWLSVSEIEGGPMDVINAFYAGIPVISRSIGYFDDIKTKEDYVFNEYADLLYQLKQIEKNKINKLSKISGFTWNDFRDWHAGLFKEINKYGYKGPRKQTTQTKVAELTSKLAAVISDKYQKKLKRQPPI
ncbi:MAG: glycosyltransferase [Deltaproteobacteria bacterium]|nr:glycosyltransferase [Deltaproteobacteria bacterium]